ncbi:hypothetical protein [Nonomuraea sp. NPDC049758]|uniref:hypothetical protein n=1 Tax=Nonomuraea sp. NPDC049758 TaxID=3154360 RepID=UPI003435C55B
MSAIPTITLICNHHDCYTHAVLIGATDPSDARREAATRGWTSYHHQAHGHEHDHCPDHSQPTKPRQKRKRLRDRIRNLTPRLSMPPVPALSTTTRR